MAAPGSEPEPSGASLLGGARTWPLKRYGRFRPPAEDGDEGPNASSWKVFESNEESGHLILTIVVSGHFFISQGRRVLAAVNHDQLLKCRDLTVTPKRFTETLLLERAGLMLRRLGWEVEEGFSLIDSHKWLKVVRRADCLLLCAQAKNECRMFRVQFGGDSREQMLEHCCSCVQKLAEYVPVQVPDEQSQQLSQLGNSENQVRDPEPSASGLHTPDEPLPDSCTNLGERRSVTQLAQSILKKKSELPVVYRHVTWRPQELGPFIRLCLMDQSFPAFVEDVEKELKKLADG